MTTDLWSNKSRRSYMAVTAHYLRYVTGLQSKKKLALASCLIGFHNVKGIHNARTLARTMLHIFNRAGITNKASPCDIYLFSPVDT